MTGPFDFLTTFRSGETLTLGGAALAPAACSSAETTRPEMTEAEPMTALRIMKVRRSTPDGTWPGSGVAGTKGSGFKGSIVFLSWLPPPLWPGLVPIASSPRRGSECLGSHPRAGPG